MNAQQAIELTEEVQRKKEEDRKTNPHPLKERLKSLLLQQVEKTAKDGGSSVWFLMQDEFNDRELEIQVRPEIESLGFKVHCATFSWGREFQIRWGKQ